MNIHLSPLRADRRVVVAGVLTWFMSAVVARAQEGVLKPDKLDTLIQQTLAASGTTPLSRPAILGFEEPKLITKSIQRGDAGNKHGFMVVVPRHADGLIFFEGKDQNPFFFAMHRTGEHLNRVASAVNRNGQLSSWSGREAEDNFASQKAFWAGDA